MCELVSNEDLAILSGMQTDVVPKMNKAVISVNVPEKKGASEETESISSFALKKLPQKCVPW
jgi:hypothetical protein